MPSSISHSTVAYIIHKLNKTLILPALIVGSIVPDIDILIYYLTVGSLNMGRELFHSIVGMATYGTLISVVITVFAYPRIVSTVFRLDKEETKQACRFSKTLVVSCLIGGFSHILIDSSCHDYNPLFYPFTKQSIDVLLFTNDWKLSYAIVEISILIMLLITLIVETRKGIKGFWKRILVGRS